MGYERYPRGTQPGDEYNRQDMDYGRDDGSGRDQSYSSARDYQAAGEFGRNRGQGRDENRDRDQGRYGSREYGNQRYGQREQFGQGGRDYYGGRNYAEDQGGRGRYGDRGGGYQGSGYQGGGDQESGGYRGSYASEGRRPEEGGRYGQPDRNRGGERQSGGGDGRQPQGYDYEDRGFMARAGDEVRSWFGDDDAERRREMDSRMDERRYDAPHHDEHYHNWRSGQIAALDRDYDEYRREHRSKFENEFSSWRTSRQGQRDSLNKVEEHMDVVGSDGSHVGTVDKVRGDRIILTKNDADAGGRHHSIPSSWIASVEGKVTLSKSADDAKRAWRDEERSQAMSGNDEHGGGRQQSGMAQAPQTRTGQGQAGQSQTGQGQTRQLAGGQSDANAQDATGKY